MLAKLILATALFLSLAACQEKDAALVERPRISDKTGTNDIASCEYEPEEGERADLTYLKSTKMTDASFNKSYDRNWLTAVHRASGIETTELVEKTGAQVYKLITRVKGCSFFKFLKAAPTDLEKVWRSAAGSAAGGGSILGLYLPVSEKFESTRNASAILVREITDRYTLVHEFMHHNFSSHLIQKTGISDQELKDQIARDSALLEGSASAYKSSRTVENAQRLVDSIKSVIKGYDQLMVRYPLEEIAIESILGRDYEVGNLRNVSELSYINGGVYIEANRDSYVKVMKLLMAGADQINLDLEAEHRELMTKAFAETKSEIERHTTEADKLVLASEKRRHGYNYRDGISAFGGDQSGIALPQIGCKHSDDINAWAERAAEKLAKHRNH